MGYRFLVARVMQRAKAALDQAQGLMAGRRRRFKDKSSGGSVACQFNAQHFSV